MHSAESETEVFEFKAVMITGLILYPTCVSVGVMLGVEEGEFFLNNRLVSSWDGSRANQKYS